MKTSILLDHEPVADGGWLLRALLRIEGEPRADEDRVPLNLSLVLDRSGSMAGEKLAAARDAAINLVKRLSPDDTVSVVAYDHGVATVAPPATGDEQVGLTSEIASIYAGGSTNLSGGWLQGREFVAGEVREGGVNRVLLLTDGLANQGITDPDKLTGLCRTAAENGITTTTIGFGEGYDENLLSEMADAGLGAAYYIEKPDQAGDIFDEELQGLLSMSAQNVTVRIVPSDNVEAPTVLHSYPAHVEGNALVLSIGDLYAREPRPILAEFLLKPAADGQEDEEVEVAAITITAHVVTADGGVELQETKLPLRLSPVQGGLVEPEVRREVLLVEAAQARRKALEARERGDWDGARQGLMSASLKMRPFADRDDVVREELADLELMKAKMSQREFAEADAKYMHYRARHGSRGERSRAEKISRSGREDQD